MAQNIDSCLTSVSFLFLILITMFCPLKQNQSGRRLGIMNLWEIITDFVVFSVPLSFSAPATPAAANPLLRLPFLLFIKFSPSKA